MPTFVYASKCEGCGKCVEICPSDIMRFIPGGSPDKKAFNSEPNYCWECCSCVKECRPRAIGVRGYADFAPLGSSLSVVRDKERNVIEWTIRYRDGTKKEFTFPIRTTPWGSIKSPLEFKTPNDEDRGSERLSNEDDGNKSH